MVGSSVVGACEGDSVWLSDGTCEGKGVGVAEGDLVALATAVAVKLATDGVGSEEGDIVASSSASAVAPTLVSSRTVPPPSLVFVIVAAVDVVVVVTPQTSQYSAGTSARPHTQAFETCPP